MSTFKPTAADNSSPQTVSLDRRGVWRRSPFGPTVTASLPPVHWKGATGDSSRLCSDGTGAGIGGKGRGGRSGGNGSVGRSVMPIVLGGPRDGAATRCDARRGSAAPEGDAEGGEVLAHDRLVRRAGGLLVGGEALDGVEHGGGGVRLPCQRLRDTGRGEAFGEDGRRACLGDEVGEHGDPGRRRLRLRAE